MTALSVKQRWWVTTTAVVALVLIYLSWWSTYAYTHTSAQFELSSTPTAQRGDTAIRLVSLRVGTVIENQGSGEDETADAGTVFVVAELAVTPLVTMEYAPCEVKLLGEGFREWDSTYPPVTRTAESSCGRNPPVGRETAFEAVFVIPARDAGQLLGVAVPDLTSSDPTAVLQPAP